MKSLIMKSIVYIIIAIIFILIGALIIYNFDKGYLEHIKIWWVTWFIHSPLIPLLTMVPLAKFFKVKLKLRIISITLLVLPILFMTVTLLSAISNPYEFPQSTVSNI